ncbi:hypothetical protein Avbf_04509 [Armadillidium vulgare]|nr:hypothetical protein Avbf_04509 [Armadillidium vulgare]
MRNRVLKTFGFQSQKNIILIILLQFSISYLCELGFSTLTTVKCKKRASLQSVDEEMKICFVLRQVRIMFIISRN